MIEEDTDRILSADLGDDLGDLSSIDSSMIAEAVISPPATVVAEPTTPPEPQPPEKPLCLRLLAAAFQVCPDPSAEQYARLSERLVMPVAEVQEWFNRRRLLQRAFEDKQQARKDEIAKIRQEASEVQKNALFAISRSLSAHALALTQKTNQMQ